VSATLVGLTGKKRAGKDTVAARLVERHGFARVAFADPLKEAALGLDPLVRIEVDEVGPLAQVVGSQVFQPHGYYRLSSVVAAAGWEAAKEVREVRRTLQRYGVAIRDLSPEFWVAQGLAKAEALLDQGTSVVITDVRFPNELDAIGGAGGFHVHVDRPGVDTSDPHPSETALEPFYDDADVEVLNHGSLGDLHDAVDTMVRYLAVGR
jgi:hypothetical protein